MTSKTAIRQEMRARRKALSPEARARAAGIVCDKILAHPDVAAALDPFDGWGALAVYLASPDEIDLTAAIEGMLARSVTVVAPRWNGETYELAKLKSLGGGSSLPILAVCNPDDVTLRYVYAIAGGEKSVAFGANGTLEKVPNVEEYVTPADITKQVKIDADWAKIQFLKDIANHHEAFYFEYLRRIVEGEEASGAVMVPQSLPTLELKVTDAELWWDVLEAHEGWKLERNKLTGHARILDPQKVRKAWGTVAEMKKSFDKVKNQL